MQSNSYGNKIILIGFMGTGKSSVADGLASELQIHNFDVDAEIVKHAGREISEIFTQDGEEAFRDIETKVLGNLLTSAGVAVIATGGGAVLREVNRNLMLQHGLVIQLSASSDVIISRVQHDTSRPLLQGDVAERVHHLMSVRANVYDFAHLTIDTSKLHLTEVIDHIVKAWHHANLK